MIKSLRILTYSSVLVFSFVVGANAQSQPRSACSQQRLQNATAAYSIGRFSSTFQELSPCLPEGFSSKSQLSQAWKLMALSYLAIDSVAAAEASVRSLLIVDKRFQPNPQIEPLLFVNLVRDLKPRWYSWPWKGGEWYKWAGRGLLVGTAIALPMLLKKDELGSLPRPPANPILN